MRLTLPLLSLALAVAVAAFYQTREGRPSTQDMLKTRASAQVTTHEIKPKETESRSKRSFMRSQVAPHPRPEPPQASEATALSFHYREPPSLGNEQSVPYLYDNFSYEDIQQAFEDQIKSLQKLVELAEITSIDCKEKSCELRFRQNPEDNATIQMEMSDFFLQHQEYGRIMSFDSVDNDPASMVYTFTMDEQR